MRSKLLLKSMHKFFIFFLVMFLLLFTGCIDKFSYSLQDFNPLKIYLEKKVKEEERKYLFNIDSDPSSIELSSSTPLKVLYLYFTTTTEFKHLYISHSPVIGINIRSTSDLMLDRKIDYASWMKGTKVTIPLEISIDPSSVKRIKGTEVFFYFYIYYSFHQTIKYSIFENMVKVELPSQEGPLIITNAYGTYFPKNNQVSLYFEIENIGDGLFFDPSIIERDFKMYVESRFFNKIQFLRYNIGREKDKEIDKYDECEVGEYINNKIKVRCNIILNSESLAELEKMKKEGFVFSKVTNVWIKYGYLINKKIYISIK